MFIVIEGLDGSGKSTLIRALALRFERERPGSVRTGYEPHDPSCGGDYLRAVLTKRITQFSNRSLVLAFAANRMDHRHRHIDPWLATEGKVYLCDRAYLSSLVYQKSDEYTYDDILELNRDARRPDLTIFLNVTNATARARMDARGAEPELFETNLEVTRAKYFAAIDYLRTVRGERVEVVDADGTPEEVLAAVWAAIHQMGNLQGFQNLGGL